MWSAEIQSVIMRPPFPGRIQVVLRSLFHATLAAQWTQLAQRMLPAMGFGGAASAVAVDNPTNTEAPFHYSFDYQRKPFSDWENLRFAVPVPPLAVVYREPQGPRQQALSSMHG